MSNAPRSFAVASLLVSLAAAGCAGGVEPGGSTGPVHAEPPAPGAVVAPDGAGHVTFAINTLLVGDLDREGSAVAGAWKQYGFDLDGKISGVGQPDGLAGLCAPLGSASAAVVHLDGDDGIDNAFGKSLLPLILGVEPRFSSGIGRALGAGGTTVLIDLDGLGAGGDYTGMTARLYTGAPLGKTPVYDGSDVWPVRADSLLSPGDVGSARLSVTDSYVVGDTWVGRFEGELTLELPWLDTLTMHLRVRDPILSMSLDAARGRATLGTLAGVISTADLLAEAAAEALLVDPTLCPATTTVASILAELGAVSDILVDGTQDPATACDGISIGLGFNAARVTRGSIVAPAPASPPVACALHD